MVFVLFKWRFHCSFNIEQLFLIMRWFFSGFPIVGAWGGSPHLTIFFEILPPTKTDAPPLAPFLVNLEACRFIADNLTIKWLLHRYFLPAFYALPMLPPCFDLNSPSPTSNFEEPPMFATPLGNPTFGGEKDSEVVIKATSFIKFFWKFKYTYYLAALVFVFIA